jgi:hypothetical protein
MPTHRAMSFYKNLKRVIVRSVGKRYFFQTFFSTGSTHLDPTLLCARAPLTLEELCARYRSPVSGSITTISVPLFSGRAATFKAAQVAAPLDIPTTNCSSLQSKVQGLLRAYFVLRSSQHWRMHSLSVEDDVRNLCNSSVIV